MDTVPIWAHLIALVFLILLSAFFSISGTALLTLNQHRVRILARQGSRLARMTLFLLDRIEKVQTLILIANILLNVLITALATALLIGRYGNHPGVIAAAALLVAFLLIIFAELAPKAIGSRRPERIALRASILLKPLTVVASPAIWLVNQCVGKLLRLFRVEAGGKARDSGLSPEELRAIVLEAESFIPQKHKSILLNLFELERVSVEDVMTPRAQIEALNLLAPIADIRHQLATCYHNKLPVYEGEINRIVGILHVRKALALLEQDEELDAARIRAMLAKPYFIPQDTDALRQLQYFQEKHERLGIIVDEYGEVQGLVTLEDIIEELIGSFTTTLRGTRRADGLEWNAAGECLLDGTTSLRDINKQLGLEFPLDGPKTLNGLLLEELRDIPDAPVCLQLGGCTMEIVKVQDQSIKVVKLIRQT